MYCAQCGAPNTDNARFCGACGTSVPTTASAHAQTYEGGSQVTEALKIVAEPFIQYGKALGELGKPNNIADKITNGRFAIPDVLRYSIAASVVSAIIARLFHEEAGLTNTPYLDEVLSGLIIVCMGLVNIIFHLPLKFAGGKGRFAQTAYACIYVSLCYLPFITLAEAFTKTSNAAFSVLELMQLTPILARIHGLSRKKTALILWTILLILVAIVLGVVFASSS
jgi:zinc-ribbon domain